MSSYHLAIFTNGMQGCPDLHHLTGYGKRRSFE